MDEYLRPKVAVYYFPSLLLPARTDQKVSFRFSLMFCTLKRRLHYVQDAFVTHVQRNYLVFHVANHLVSEIDLCSAQLRSEFFVAVNPLAAPSKYTVNNFSYF